MEFLYSRNRLNVATSRARCACVLVAGPRLLEPECRTIRQMQLASALCRYVEMAKLVYPSVISRRPGYDHPDRPGAPGPPDLKTTMIYTHVLNRGGHGVRSPADLL